MMAHEVEIYSHNSVREYSISPSSFSIDFRKPLDYPLENYDFVSISRNGLPLFQGYVIASWYNGFRLIDLFFLLQKRELT